MPLNDTYYRKHLPAMVWRNRGVMVIHVGRKWTMDKITTHADNECRAVNDLAVAIEVSEFGEIGQPKRKFVHSVSGEWVEVPVKPWSKSAIASYHKFLGDAIKAARSKTEKT